jgi:hypothetical protein
MSAILKDMKGIYQDRLIQSGGSVLSFPWRSNIVVQQCHFLIAAFMKGELNPQGVSLLSVGRGLDTWESQPPLPPTDEQQQLVDPKPFKLTVTAEQIQYLDQNGSPTIGPSRWIQVTTTLGPGLPSVGEGEAFPLREFALFGKLGKEFYMIDYVRHPVIHKQAGDTLVRTIRLVL